MGAESKTAWSAGTLGMLSGEVLVTRCTLRVEGDSWLETESSDCKVPGFGVTTLLEDVLGVWIWSKYRD